MSDFKGRFEQLTGHRPLSWQTRLYERFVAGDLPNRIDLPTGLGKTMVMAIWLIAREKNPKLPRRLVYVVDRRTVVDQATKEATKLQKSVGESNLAISTLRGQLADNRDWSRDPSRPAIIIGTVDLIGSALLFSGYRSSHRRRPLEAGLLGMDSLLVLDEAHLSKPFEKLLDGITDFNRSCDAALFPESIKPLKAIRMSATTAEESTNRFTLEESDLNDKTIVERFTAKKSLSIKTLGDKDKPNDTLADAAITLATRTDLRGSRIVVFVRRPADAIEIAKRIREHAVESIDESGPKPKKSKSTPYADSVEVLTGTMRGLERDELVEKPVLKRFLDGDEDPNADPQLPPVFLVSTSAGEVGFDLNADHMVCDATTIDSFIQRLGRVNRRGLGKDAQVVLVLPKELPNKTAFDKACIEAKKLLTDGMSLSPQNIAKLKANEWKHSYAAACSPTPATVPLTDILLDAWSMTSITGPMPGRPDVAPWLRGTAEWEPPQTSVAWRAELDLPGFADLDPEDVEEWFDTHRVLTHETLSDRSDRVAAELLKRWENLKTALAEPELEQLANSAVCIDRAGMETITLAQLIERITDNSGKPRPDAIRNADLILPASFGGIERKVGLLDAEQPKLDTAEESKPPDEKAAILRQRQDETDVADIAPGWPRQRCTESSIDGEKQPPEVLGSGAAPTRSARFMITLESDDDKTVKLVSYVPKFERPDTGDTPQSLEEHVKDVRKRADDIIEALQLPEKGSIRLALELAADYHDHGKNRAFFQCSVGGTPSTGQRPWPSHVLGKSGGKDFRKAPRGYRHEFGSLREFSDAFQQGKLLDHSGKTITSDVFDLASHLIAAHHGRGRPQFPKGGFDPDAEDRSDTIHTDAIRRFARLQRTYGWWTLAWLENLLRCADAMASANPTPRTPPGR